MQIANKGKLHLIHPTFVEWASELILFAMNFFTDLKMIKHRRETVDVAAQHLKDNKSLFFSFREAALSVDGINERIPGDDTLLMIHTMLIKQAFNAYTSFRWGSHFRGDKDSSDDKTNLAF